ncbi:MAG: alpha/beta fold hydrolase [Alphaproteobacteria bacterium]|nr:alpha/beta fold hydrolase [Alphaproteobacteria bacterium]
MSEKYVQSKSINLWTEAFGDPKNPSVILISGAASQGVSWSADFCNLSASHGFYIVRFDPRDTGLSTHIDFTKTPYKMNDMADDVTQIMNAYGFEKTHIVGTSMGGYIAQILSIDHPSRVQSLTLLMSTMDFTPQVYSFMGMSTAFLSLSGPKPEALEQLKNLFSGADLSNPEVWMDKSLKTVQIFNGDQAPFDEEEYRKTLKLAFERMNPSVPIKTPHNHALASGFGPTQFAAHKIKCPALIIHGSNDPIIPVDHAHATAKAIEHSEKFIIEGMGHARPKVYDKVIADRLGEFWKSSKDA